MKTLRTLLLAAALGGCTLAAPPCPDAGPLPDAAPVVDDGARFGARAACGVAGAQYRLMAFNGLFDEAMCAQEACPFEYSPMGSPEQCDAAAVEACYWALAGANDCETYRAAMAGCDGASCR